MNARSPIFTDIDYEKDGRQVSFLRLPYSPHTDAWGVIPIPIAVIKNGRGPTVLLMGGNHGDEYEGPIVLGRLLRGLDPGSIRGRLIFLPAANLPAVAAGRRVSAVDDKNMNRTFPGDPWAHPPSRSRITSTACSSRCPRSCSTSIPAAPPSTSCRAG